MFVFSEPSLVRAEVLTLWAIKTSSWTWNRWYLHCPPPTNTKRRPQTMVGYYLLYTHTHTLSRHTQMPSYHRPLESHMGSPLWHIHMHNPQTESVNWAAEAPIPPSVLSPWRHQLQNAKNTLPMILPECTTMPVCVCVCMCLTLCVFPQEGTLCDLEWSHRPSLCYHYGKLN